MVSIANLKAELVRRRAAAREEDLKLRALRARWENLHFAAMQPEHLLHHASTEERSNLATILAIPPGANSTQIAGALGKAGSHTVATALRRGAHVSYVEIASDVAAKVGAQKAPPSDSLPEIERRAVQALINDRLASATPQEREAILAEFQGSSGIRSTSGAAGALVVANLSGFALYTAASTALAGVTGAIGLTLPFAAYTGMSSALATVTGPVGWLALGAYLIYKAGGVDYKKTIPAVLAIAAVRARLTAESERAVHALSEGEGKLRLEIARVDRLEHFVAQQLAKGLDDASTVPRSTVPH